MLTSDLYYGLHQAVGYVWTEAQALRDMIRYAETDSAAPGNLAQSDKDAVLHRNRERLHALEAQFESSKCQ